MREESERLISQESKGDVEGQPGKTHHRGGHDGMTIEKLKLKILAMTMAAGAFMIEALNK